MKTHSSSLYHSTLIGKPAWVDESLVLTTPNGKTAIDTYHKNKAPTRKKVRTAPPAPKQQPRGWHPTHTTFTTSPINPDLDAIPTATYEITQHPTNHSGILLHAPDGRLITTITKARLQKLANLYNPTDTNTTLPEAIANLTHRHTTIDPIRTQPIETKI